MPTQSLFRRLSILLLAGTCIPLVMILLLPGTALLQRFSFSDFWFHLREPATRDAIYLSAITSTITTVLVAIAGTPLAYVLARWKGVFVRVLETVVEMPTVFPPVVAGVTLLLAFGRNGLLGAWLAAHGIQIVFTPVAVVIAQIFVAGPFYVRTAALGFSAVPSDTLDAAKLDGADWLAQLRHITMPQAWRAILSGMALCWARAVGEFGATMIFAGNMPGRTQTMTLAVYLGFESDLNQALALATILLVLSFTVLFLARMLLTRFESR